MPRGAGTSLGHDAVCLYVWSAAVLVEILDVCARESDLHACVDMLYVVVRPFCENVVSWDESSITRLEEAVDAHPGTVGRAVVPLLSVAHALVCGLFLPLYW